MDDCANTKIVNQFLDISKESNIDTAQYYLEVAGQDIEKAINLYFQDKLEFSEDQRLSQGPAVNSKMHSQKYFTILQWNIQGLLDDCLKERTVAVVEEIKKLLPDVVMMQEVIPSVFNYIKSACQNYKLVSAVNKVSSSYFTLIMTKSDSFLVKSHQIIMFPDSKQGRDLTIVTGSFQKRTVTVMTSHLESLAQGSLIRMEQLKMVWEKMVAQDSSHTVIFGGDTNLRAAEVTKTSRKHQNLSDKIDDIWTKLGSPDEARYTWDCSKNDNQIKDSMIRSRYDRLYIRREDSKDTTFLHPVSMELIGTDRLPCGMFPSDHWGVLVRLSQDPITGM